MILVRINRLRGIRLCVLVIVRVVILGVLVGRGELLFGRVLFDRLRRALGILIEVLIVEHLVLSIEHLGLGNLPEPPARGSLLIGRSNLRLYPARTSFVLESLIFIRVFVLVVIDILRIIEGTVVGGIRVIRLIVLLIQSLVVVGVVILCGLRVVGLLKGFGHSRAILNLGSRHLGSSLILKGLGDTRGDRICKVLLCTRFVTIETGILSLKLCGREGILRLPQ